MFVEKKKIGTTGNSLSVTLKPNGSSTMQLEKGTEVEISYKKNEIVIKLVKNEN